MAMASCLPYRFVIQARVESLDAIGCLTTSDPQSWLDTVTTTARAQKDIAIAYEDSISTIDTTQTNQSFTLQQLFSLAG
jgi:hypothetical protein